MARKRRRNWGSGSVEQLRSGYWRIRWREADGERKTAKYPDRGDAEAVLAKILANVRAGKPSGYTAPTSSAGPLMSKLAADWLERRQRINEAHPTMYRAWRDDRNRWNKHLAPTVGHMRPAEITSATVRNLIEAKLAEKKKNGEGLSPKSVGNIVMTLSSLFADLIEHKHATSNPARGLAKDTLKLIRGTHDPKTTPHIERQADVARVYAALPQPHATIFAVTALGGLRPGEVLALEWGDIDLSKRQILVRRQVRHGRVGVPKGGKPRLVPVIAPLATILAEYRLATGGAGLVFKPLVERKGSKFIKDRTTRKALRTALVACGLPPSWTLYQCGRHTYASLHVMGGGSLAVLGEILGHVSPTTTARYAHLSPDKFKPDDLIRFTADMSREGATVTDLAAARAEKAGQVGHEMTTAEGADAGNGA